MKRFCKIAALFAINCAALVAIVAHATLAIAQETPAQPEAKPITAAQINLQAFEAAKTAKTEEEFNKLIGLCQQGLETQPSPQEKKYANQAAQQQAEYEQQLAAQAPAEPQVVYVQAPPEAAPAPAAPAPAGIDMEQLKQLGELHTAGVLTDEEFATAKAKLLG